MSTIPPEIWIHVLSFLRRPLPAPNGRHEELNISSPDLASAARVSKLFNNLVGPLLYTDIVTDDLPALIYNVDAPAAASGIKSKFQLICSAKRLFLEYRIKSEPSYSSLMLHGGEYHFARLALEESTIADMCQAECEAVIAGALKLDTLPLKLVTLAICAFRGGQSSAWRSFFEKTTEAHREKLESAQIELGICTSFNRIRYFCHRSEPELGPLAYSATVRPTPSRPARVLRHRSHLHLDCSVPVIMGKGSTSRWYTTYTVSDRSLPTTSDMVARATAQHLLQREACWPSSGGELAARLGKYPFISVDIYLPPWITAPADISHIQKHVDSVNQAIIMAHSIPESRTSGDRWKVHAMKDAPACEACGWRPEDG